MSNALIKCILLIAVFVFTSCATINSPQRGQGSSFNVKGKKYSDVWKAANRVVAQQLTIVTADKYVGEIRAEKGVGFATWGEVVGVFISPTVDSPEYLVEVQSLKRSRLQLTGQNWEKTIIQGMKAELD